jgi:hypothetical protein
MTRNTRDAAIQAAFDRFHDTATTNRRSAVSQLHTDMRKAGGPAPTREEEK